MEKSTVNDAASASLIRGGVMSEGGAIHGRYMFECFDSSGKLKWRDHVDNMIVTEGKNDILDKYLAGSGYTAAHYLGLISSVGYTAIAAADTMASHSGWTEAGPTNAPDYDETVRQTPSFAAASGGSKATSAAVSFTINEAGTLKGSFLTTNSTKDGTTGILVSAGLFSGGDRSVVATDVINVSYTMSLT